MNQVIASSIAEAVVFAYFRLGSVSLSFEPQLAVIILFGIFPYKIRASSPFPASISRFRCVVIK
jgi:hypothetical protein